MKFSAKHNFYLFTGFSACFILSICLAILTSKYYLACIPFILLLFYTGWQSLPALFFILIASIPFSMEYQFSNGLGTDLPDEMLMLLTAGLFLLHLVNRSSLLFWQALSHPLMLSLFGILVWVMISSLFSSLPLLSFKFILAKGWYIAAFIGAALLVCVDKRNIKLLAMVLAVAMLAVTLIIQIRHAQTAFSFAGINDAVLPFFRNHVNYSSLLVCTLPIWYAWWRNTTVKKHRNFVATVIIILLFALILSYARGAWLALLVGIVGGWLLHKKWLLRVSLVFTVTVLLGIGWLAHQNRYLAFAPDHDQTIFHEDFGQHMIATYELKDASAAERFYRWIAGMRMIPDHWVTGFGPGTFYPNYRPYTVPAFETWVSDNPEHSTVHNYFLLTAIEQGIPGLLLLLLLCGLVLYHAQRLYHRTKDHFYKTASLATGVIFIMVLTLNFLSDLVETDKIGSLFFLCIAVLAIIDSKSEQHT